MELTTLQKIFEVDKSYKLSYIEKEADRYAKTLEHAHTFTDIGGFEMGKNFIYYEFYPKNLNQSVVVSFVLTSYSSEAIYKCIFNE